jgi:hypothetical protein
MVFAATCLSAVSLLFTTIPTSCRTWNKEGQTEQGKLCFFVDPGENLISFIFMQASAHVIVSFMQMFVSKFGNKYQT